SPARRMRVPSSTPAGMLTDSVRSFWTRPEPEQSLHGSSIVSPRPWQAGHVRAIVKKPWLARTFPTPPHVAQMWALVPGLAPEPAHVSHLTLAGTRICAVLPEKASVSVISRL